MCVREQKKKKKKSREGEDLPRLLAGVMHKTEPGVYMQRQKEREREIDREREINVLIEGGEQQG